MNQDDFSESPIPVRQSKKINVKHELQQLRAQFCQDTLSQDVPTYQKGRKSFLLSLQRARNANGSLRPVRGSTQLKQTSTQLKSRTQASTKQDTKPALSSKAIGQTPTIVNKRIEARKLEQQT
jgi:hypothetical protein